MKALKIATVFVALLLAGFVGYLPFELRECDRLVAEHGPKFFCVPIGFIAIPLLAFILLILLLAFAIKNWLRGDAY